MTDNPFSNHLIPNPPTDTPEAPGPGDAMASLSPFAEPIDADTVIKNLVLDRPLRLYVPDADKYPDWEFRIVNGTPDFIAAAHNKGFREITDPKMVELFKDLVAGTTKEGKAFRPLLMARPKKVGEHIRRQHRQQLASLYAGMDPAEKDFGSKYTENANVAGGSKANFTGPGWRIRI